MVSSAAHFYHKPAALCEAFHSIGWGMTLQDMKWTFDWLLVHGIDWFIVHGFFYTTNGLKKHDAPPSAFFQMPWWKDMHHLSPYAGQLIRTARQAKRRVPVLLLDPVTSYWTADDKDKAGVLEEFSRLQRALFSHQLDYYIIDPQLFAEGQVKCREGRTELLINGEGFSYVMLPSIQNLEDGCYLKIKEFAEAGGMLAAVGSLAGERIMELNPGDWMEAYFKEGRGKSLYGQTPEEACGLLKKEAGGYVLTGADGLGMDEILSVEYEKENGDRFYFIVNTSKENRVFKGNILEGELKLGALQSGFYPLNQKGFLTLPKDPEAEICISLDGQWDMELHEKNVLRLGFWKLKSQTTGQETDSLVESMPVIDQIKKGNMLIPLESKEAFGCLKDLVLSPDTYWYQTEFEAEEAAMGKPAYLVMEPQGIQGYWEIELNGHLYYMFCSMSLCLTPLNKRPEDTEYLLEAYLKNYMERYQKFHTLSEHAKKALLQYPWNGGRIQLERFCERLILTAGKRTITERSVTELLAALYEGTAPDDRPYTDGNQSSYEQLLRDTLKQYHGNKGLTAKALQISTTTLWRKMKKYGIE